MILSELRLAWFLKIHFPRRFVIVIAVVIAVAVAIAIVIAVAVAIAIAIAGITFTC
jgi:hypothetical protein